MGDKFVRAARVWMPLSAPLYCSVENAPRPRSRGECLLVPQYY
jgi:hypothetical protein